MQSHLRAECPLGCWKSDALRGRPQTGIGMILAGNWEMRNHFADLGQYGTTRCFANEVDSLDSPGSFEVGICGSRHGGPLLVDAASSKADHQCQNGLLQQA